MSKRHNQGRLPGGGGRIHLTPEQHAEIKAARDAAKEQFARAVALLREEYQRRFLADEAHHEWSKRVGDLLAEQEAK